MLQRIKIHHFRNLTDIDVHVDNKHVIIRGENGEGKTNFLEAIYYLSFASSFRERKDAIICQLGQTSCAVFGIYSTDDGPERIGVQWDNGHKSVKMNGQFLKDRKELLQRVPCIAFCHHDLLLAHGEMDERRRFFDQVMSLLSPDYIDDLRQYKKVLRQRNAMLKNKLHDLWLVYTQQLIGIACKIIKQRRQVLSQFNDVFVPMMHNMSGKDMHCTYHTHWHDEMSFDEILQYYTSKQDQEWKQGTTLYGPHRDKYQFMHDDKDMAAYFSLGQKRQLVLALKSAQARLVYELSHKKPIFILDDVFLELSQKNQEQVFDHLPPYEQAFFAFLPDHNVLSIQSPLIYEIKQGIITAS